MFRRMFVQDIVVTVEGCIGTGKSSFLDFFQSKKNFHIRKEPLDEWTSANNQFNLLRAYYENPDRNSFLFQTHVILTNQRRRIQQNRGVTMVERLMGHKIFARLLHMDGKLTDMEMYVLTQLDLELQRHLPTPQLTIYLQCSAETAVTRVAKRGRGEEKSIKLDYLRRLVQQHDEWLIDQCDLIDGRIWVVNCELELESLKEIYQILEARLKKRDLGNEKITYFGFNK